MSGRGGEDRARSTGPGDASRRLEQTWAVIDAANSVDPNWIRVRGRQRPKELAHAELVTEWVQRLAPSASEALLLAARAHHLERWQLPRDQFPAGRSGYLRWRKRLQLHHAERAGILLAGERYPEETILRVQELIRKRGLGRDPEAQVLEDALCLVFLETQLGELAARTPEEKMLDIARKTLAKMSARARCLASGLSFAPEERALLERAARAPRSELEEEPRRSPSDPAHA